MKILLFFVALAPLTALAADCDDAIKTAVMQDIVKEAKANQTFQDMETRSACGGIPYKALDGNSIDAFRETTIMSDEKRNKLLGTGDRFGDSWNLRSFYSIVQAKQTAFPEDCTAPVAKVAPSMVQSPGHFIPEAFSNHLTMTKEEQGADNYKWGRRVRAEDSRITSSVEFAFLKVLPDNMSTQYDPEKDDFTDGCPLRGLAIFKLFQAAQACVYKIKHLHPDIRVANDCKKYAADLIVADKKIKHAPGVVGCSWVGNKCYRSEKEISFSIGDKEVTKTIASCSGTVNCYVMDANFQGFDVQTHAACSIDAKEQCNADQCATDETTVETEVHVDGSHEEKGELHTPAESIINTAPVAR